MAPRDYVLLMSGRPLRNCCSVLAFEKRWDELIQLMSIFWIFYADSLNIFPRAIGTLADSRIVATRHLWFLAYLQETTRCDAGRSWKDRDEKGEKEWVKMFQVVQGLSSSLVFRRFTDEMLDSLNGASPGKGCG
jgi:hypothetical protein